MSSNCTQKDIARNSILPIFWLSNNEKALNISSYFSHPLVIENRQYKTIIGTLRLIAYNRYFNPHFNACITWSLSTPSFVFSRLQNSSSSLLILWARPQQTSLENCNKTSMKNILICKHYLLLAHHQTIRKLQRN